MNSLAELLEATGRLGPTELREFIAGALAIRARRDAPVASAPESELMLRINEGLPEGLVRRLHELTEKRGAEWLTADEYAELLSLTEEVEQREVARLESLVELAAIRKIPLPVLLRDLGIAAPTDD